jgi:hypothetical protein
VSNVRSVYLTVTSGRDTLDWLLTEKRIGVYVGVDPTAPSLHVGHLLPLMALYWMYLYGYNTVSLVSLARRYLVNSLLILVCLARWRHCPDWRPLRTYHRPLAPRD